VSTASIELERPPRLRPFARFGVVFRWGLRRTFLGKRFVVTLIVALVAGLGLGTIVARERDAVSALWELLDTGLLAVAVPLVALAVVGTGYGDEVQDQTLVFHLVRPVSRTTVFLARYAAGLVGGVLVASLMVASAIVAAGTSLGTDVIVESVFVAALGTVAVGALYYSLAAIFRRGLVAGLVYTFLVEGFFQFMPGSIQKLSLMHHVRGVFHRLADPDFVAASPEVARQLSPGDARLDFTDPTRLVLAAAEREEWTSIPSALLVCAIVACLALLLGARAVARKDYALKD
jgi:hypothetical protein